MKLILFALILLFSPVFAKPDCQAVQAVTGGVEIEWLGYPQGWDLPADIRLTRRHLGV